MDEHISDLFLKDPVYVVFIYIRIFRKEFRYPGGVLLDLFIGSHVFARQDVFLQKLHLLFQSCREYGESHNLDQSDVLFLDVMILCVRMIYAQRMLLCGDIVSQRQIQLEDVPLLSGDRSDGIVRFPVRLRVDEGVFVGIASPCLQHMCGEIHQALLVFVTDAQHGQGPFHDSGFHILVSGDDYRLLDLRLRHGKGVMAALEMIVA